MPRYDYTYLKYLCEKNNIKLFHDYSCNSINIFSNIEGECLNEECNHHFSKSFRSLLKTNGYCLGCSKIFGKEKIKQTCLDKYGVDNPLKCQTVKDKMKNTCMEKYGVEYSSQCKEIQDKVKETNMSRYGVTCGLHSSEIIKKVKKTCMEKYGVEYPSQSHLIKEKKKISAIKKYGVEHISQAEEVKEKKKQTCFMNHGVEHPMQSETIREKGKETCMKHFGVEYSLQSSEVRDKGKVTCLEKYGVEHPLQNEEIRNKIKETCIEKYGVEYPSQSEEVKNKIKETYLKKYGVEHNMHVPELSEKCSHQSYLSKEYTLPSEKVIKIQGYEKFAWNHLLFEEKICENDIVYERKNVPELWYLDNEGKKHRHYVDIYIPSKNLCIEVKSTWTANKKQDNIFIKQECAKELGYLYEIWVYDAKGNIVEKFM